MSTTLTKEAKLAAAEAEVNRIEALIEDLKKTAPVFPIKAATDSEEMENYYSKNRDYNDRLENIQTQLENANVKMLHAKYAMKQSAPPSVAWKAEAWKAEALPAESAEKCKKGADGCTTSGGKKSRKSHNSKKYKKSKKSHTTYKKSKRSRR